MQRRTMLYGLGAAALAPAGVAGAAVRPDSAMTVDAVQFPVWRGSGDRREPVAPGDAVSSQQELETGEGGAVVLGMEDGATVRLGEKTRLQVREYVATQPEAGRQQVQADLKLVDGFFRYATAAASQVTGRRDVKLHVRTATIGIRGTDFWTMTDAVHDAACVFEGRVDIDSRDQGMLVLDKPTAFWARFFDQPVRPVGNATPDELGRFLKSTELTPGSGVAVRSGRWRVVAAAVPSAEGAQALARRLRAAGYPAVVSLRRGLHEVRVNALATRADAEATLARLAGIEGVRGRVALSAS